MPGDLLVAGSTTPRRLVPSLSPPKIRRRTAARKRARYFQGSATSRLRAWERRAVTVRTMNDNSRTDSTQANLRMARVSARVLVAFQRSLFHANTCAVLLWPIGGRCRPNWFETLCEFFHRNIQSQRNFNRSYRPRRIALHHCFRRHGSGDNAPGGYYRSTTNRYVWQNDCTGSNRGIFLNNHSTLLAVMRYNSDP